MPNTTISLALLFTIARQQPMATRERIESLACIIQEGAGMPAGLQFRVRYGIPALAEQETALDCLITLGYLIRPSRVASRACPALDAGAFSLPPDGMALAVNAVARRLRAVLPPEPEWEREMDRHQAAMQHLETLGSRSDRELQLMAALTLASRNQRGREPRETVGRMLPGVPAERLRRLQEELSQRGLLPG